MNQTSITDGREMEFVLWLLFVWPFNRAVGHYRHIHVLYNGHRCDRQHFNDLMPQRFAHQNKCCFSETILSCQQTQCCHGNQEIPALKGTHLFDYTWPNAYRALTISCLSQGHAKKEARHEDG